MNTESLLESLRLPDNFNTSIAGVKQPLKATYGKLNRYRFSRVHPDDDFKLGVLLATDKEGDRESYLVLPSLGALLGSMVTQKILRLAVDNAGVPRLIAEPLLDPNGRPNLWNSAYLNAIKMGETSWVRVESNMEAGQYQVIVAQGDLGPPAWPKQSMDQLVLQCFEGRIIQSADHPLIRQLEGRV
jgi:hypothetical protein